VHWFGIGISEGAVVHTVMNFVLHKMSEFIEWLSNN